MPSRDTTPPFDVVTGASGFIGGALMRRLLGEGRTVRAVSRRPPPARDAPEQAGRLEWVQADLRDPGALGDALVGAAAVFHVAGLVDMAAGFEEARAANVETTRTVCAAAARAGVGRLVFVSTCDVFGAPAPGEVIDETTPYRRWGLPYPDTKIEASRVVRDAGARGLPVSLIYPGMVYGPGDRSFLPTLSAHVRTGVMALWGPRDFQLQLVFIEDLVDALLLAAEAEAAVGEGFLVLEEASGVTLAALARRLARAFRRRMLTVRAPTAAMRGLAQAAEFAAARGWVGRPLLTRTEVAFFAHDFRFSTAKARRLLGWRPRTRFEAGFAAAVEDLRAAER